MIRIQSTFLFRPAVLLAAAAVLVFGSTSAQAASAFPLAAFQDWWLNPNYAEHGRSMDQIFYFIFWITTVIMVAVEVVLVWFLIKYRHRPDCKKGIYSHGNTRLEMIWTIIPAIILIAVVLWTKRVWDAYRYSPISADPNRLTVLVIGEQFKWNVIYPGPGGKIGRYLLYPKTTDLKWPGVPAGKSFNFPDAPGPAYLPEEQARRVINKYIGDINPLGRDYSDPDTDPLLPEQRARYDEITHRIDELNAKKSPSDDEQDELKKLGKEAEPLARIADLNEYSNANGRALVIPKGRPVEIQISSRDVIHDFFLPDFRTKLDTVPGMRGKLYLTATASRRDMGAGTQEYTLDQLEDLIVKQKRVVNAVANETTAGANHFVRRRPKADYWRYADKDNQTIISDALPISSEIIAQLRANGFTKVTATVPFYWDIVCEELCGIGHKDMQGKLVVVDEGELRMDEFKNYFPRRPVMTVAPSH